MELRPHVEASRKLRPRVSGALAFRAGGVLLLVEAFLIFETGMYGILWWIYLACMFRVSGIS